MSSRDAFWEHVHAALDARRDPLDDSEVQRRVAAEPRLLAELAELRAGLDLLARRRRRRSVSLAAAALLVAVAGLAATWAASRGAAGPKLVPRAAELASAQSSATLQQSEPGASRVLAFRAEVTTGGPRGRRTTRYDGRGVRVTRETCAPSAAVPGQALGFVALASHLEPSR